MASTAFNIHILNIVYALEKTGNLEVFCTTFADNYFYRVVRKLRKLFAQIFPLLDQILKKRKIKNLPDNKICKYPYWEIIRIFARIFFLNKRVSDFFWEKGEYYFDKQTAKLIQKEKFNLFLGVEHSCLSTLAEAKRKGKKTVLFFLSPHHSFFKKWVIPEYKKFPELLDLETEKLMKLSRARDRRRDQEAKIADIICTNSKLVTNSFIAAGFLEQKIITVPLGAPYVNFQKKQTSTPKKNFRFIYAGFFSVYKGAHYLLKAWDSFDGIDAQLHIYGENLLSKNLFTEKKRNIYFHGSVVQEKLFANFRRSDILVFPSLCDGFGMVAFEALAQGLPVITTKNAGVSQFIEEGKNGFLVPPADSKSLKEKMLWCVKNPNKIAQMRKEAFKTAQRRNWQDFQKDFVSKLRKKL